jgi:hypothetical protein
MSLTIGFGAMGFEAAGFETARFETAGFEAMRLDAIRVDPALFAAPLRGADLFPLRRATAGGGPQ